MDFLEVRCALTLIISPGTSLLLETYCHVRYM